MTVRYCPHCAALLTRNNGSRFYTCPDHGKLKIEVSVVGER